MTFIFFLKVFLAFLAINISGYIVIKILVYPFIVLSRWLTHKKTIFYHF